MKIDREKTMFDVLYSKQAFLNKTTSVSKTHKISIYAKGQSLVLVKNLKFGERFVLCKMHPEKVLGDALVGNQAFLDNINMDLKGRQNWHFFKGDSR